MSLTDISFIVNLPVRSCEYVALSLVTIDFIVSIDFSVIA